MRKYLLSVVAAAFLVSLVEALPQKRSTHRILALCGGIFLLLTVVRPMLSLTREDVSRYFSSEQADTSVIDEAVENRQKESARLITQRTQEYILDKAAALGFTVEAQVELRLLTEEYQYPYSVTLRGQWTPAQKSELEKYISQTLGIPEERQIWNNQN